MASGRNILTKQDEKTLIYADGDNKVRKVIHSAAVGHFRNKQTDGSTLSMANWCGSKDISVLKSS